MDSYFTIKITGGTSTGPYTIYYDSINSGNIAQVYPSLLPATGITLTSLTSFNGVQVKVPGVTTSIILYNQKCKTSEIFQVEPGQPTLTCLCISVYNNKDNTTNNFDVCDSGQLVNGKPTYTGTTVTVSWNNNGYWELIGYTPDSVSFRSTDNDNIPNSNWLAYGGPIALQYSVEVVIGSCNEFPSINTSLIVSATDADCNENNGSISASVIFGVTPYLYSLDGVNYSNTTGIFTNLAPNTYTVYFKDGDDNIFTQNTVVNATLNTSYNIPLTISNFSYNGVSGNYKYYSFQYSWDTNIIPMGVTVTAEFELDYSVIGSGPGSVLWNVTNSSFVKNAVSQPILNIIPLSLTNGAPDTCNPIYITKTGVAKFKTNSITFVNGDTINGTVQIGINTETNGQIVLPCYTKAVGSASVNLNIISSTCECCTITSSSETRNQTQIYTP